MAGFVPERSGRVSREIAREAAHPLGARRPDRGHGPRCPGRVRRRANRAGSGCAGRRDRQAPEHHRGRPRSDRQGRFHRRRVAAERLPAEQGRHARSARSPVVARPRRTGRQAARPGRELRPRDLRSVYRGAEDAEDGRRAAAADRHWRRHRGAGPRACPAWRARRRHLPAPAGAGQLPCDVDPHAHPEEHQPADPGREGGTCARGAGVPRAQYRWPSRPSRASPSCSFSGRTGVRTARRWRAWSTS